MKIHFIGIGGIGVSALAKYYLKNGNLVVGSDLAASEITNSLKKQGVKICIGKHKAQCLTPDAISGTHGKSTTTALIASILIKAGLDPTVIVGTKLKEFGDSNCRVGKSKYLVIEADEWQASFLNYWPKIIVLTNIEKEHLDYYKNLNHILRTYKEYISHLPENGYLIANRDDKNIKKILLQARSNTFFTAVKNVFFFTLKQREAKKLGKILKVPGKHNISNALAAIAVAKILKIPERKSFQALAKYRGAWRRFEIKTYNIPNTKYKVPIISDYAHHPTEVKSTLKAAREKFKKKKIWAIFQPHQQQRTY